MKAPHTSLRSSEWFLVGSFLLILASLIFVSQMSRRKEASLISSLPRVEKVPVKIEGAVAKPDTYWVLPGTSLQAVLKKSRPKRFADLKSLHLVERVESPLEIHLEELKEIQIRVEGAVLNSVELHLPAGSRVNDLKSKIPCAPEADLSFFRKRRLLADGEIIEVPRKKEPSPPENKEEIQKRG